MRTDCRPPTGCVINDGGHLPLRHRLPTGSEMEQERGLGGNGSNILIISRTTSVHSNMINENLRDDNAQRRKMHDGT